LNLGEQKKIAVRVAYTLLACSTFLAPRQANPTIPDELFQVVLDHENLGRYDWAGYVLSHLEYAVRKLRASLTGRNEVFVLGACPVAAEVLCFFVFSRLCTFWMDPVLLQVEISYSLRTKCCFFCLFLQLFCLEWVDFGEAGLQTDIVPKIAVYTTEKVKELIKLVQDDGVNGDIMFKVKISKKY
jgi:hypothetical protein